MEPMDQEYAPALFEEEQRFRQLWIWLFLIPLGLWYYTIMAEVLWDLLVTGPPWAERPRGDFVEFGIGLVVCTLLTPPFEGVLARADEVKRPSRDLHELPAGPDPLYPSRNFH